MTQKNEMGLQNKRRKELGVEVHNSSSDADYFFSSSDSRYIRDLATSPDFDVSKFFVGSGHFERSDRMNLLRRAKLFLFRRSFADLSEDNIPKLYGANNKIETVLDCFPSLKYSYSSSLPPKVVMRNHGIPEDFYGRFKPNEVRYFDVCCAPDGSSKKARMTDLSRSASIRLDPMDAPRQLFIYRCRIRRCLAWGYSVGLVPIMMTLTIFHRWHSLKGLLRVISQSWDRFFASGRPAVCRTKRMGVQAYIRRLEETITDGVGSRGYNSGWHPHYHVILFVPADKVSFISDMEDELRSDWFDIVNHFFELEFGEKIDSSYAKSFKKHGLVFSRYSDSDLDSLTNKTSYRKQFLTKRLNGSKRPIRPVDDSDYMAKTFGCDSRMFYSGDAELTSGHVKNSRIPFDLLCDDTACNNDLWVEYALATKGVRSFVFSRGLSGRVREYFDKHPDRDSVKSFVKSDKVVAQIDSSVYGLLYRTCRVEEMLRVAVKGYDSLCEWFKDFYLTIGFSVEDITEDMMPLLPNTCLPFGDRIDVLTFSQRSKLKSNVQVDVSHAVPPRRRAAVPPRRRAAVPPRRVIDTSAEGVSTSILGQQSKTAEAVNNVNDVACDVKSSYVRLLEHVSEARVQLARSNCQVSDETLQMVASFLESEFAVVTSEGETEASKAESQDMMNDQISAYAEECLSSEGVDSIEDLSDDSIDVRINRVSNSKWYPDWYLKHLRDLKESSVRITRGVVSSMGDEVNDDKNNSS